MAAMRTKLPFVEMTKQSTNGPKAAVALSSTAAVQLPQSGRWSIAQY